MKERFFTLDLLRSIAIVLMIITHVAYFWYDYRTPAITWFADLGGWICLSIFVFVSGGTLYFLENHRQPKILPMKFIKRALIVYLWLITLALVGTRGDHLFDILIGRYTVPLTDFLWAFVWLFLATAAVLYWQLRRPFSLRAWQLGVIVVVLYSAGLIGYSQLPHLPAFFHYPLSHLVGFGDWHRFPVLQFGALYILGYMWMKYRTHWRWWHYLGAAIASFIGYAVLLPYIPFDRWSVSLPFMLYSLGFIFLILAVGTGHYKLPEIIRRLISELAHHSLAMLVIHTLLLFIATAWITQRFGGISFIIVYGIVLGVSSGLSILGARNRSGF